MEEDHTTFATCCSSMFAGGQHSDSFWGQCLAFVPSSCNIHCPAGFVFQKVPVSPVLRLLWSNVQAVLLIQMRDHTLFITWWSDE